VTGGRPEDILIDSPTPVHVTADRRTVARGLVGLTVGLTGCLGRVREAVTPSPTFRLDFVDLTNAAESPTTFQLTIDDGGEQMYEGRVDLPPRDGETATYRAVEKPWMETPGRYGVTVDPDDSEAFAVSFEDITHSWDSSINEYDYMSYSVIYRPDETFGVYPDFYDEPRSVGGE
jgi:hypothetical protein